MKTLVVLIALTLAAPAAAPPATVVRPTGNDPFGGAGFEIRSAARALDEDDLAGARGFIDRVRAKDPAQPRAGAVLACILAREGKVTEAVTLAETSLAAAPADPWVGAFRALCLHHASRGDEALAAAQAAAKAGGDEPETRRLLALILFARKDFAGALAELAPYLAKVKDNPSAWRLRAVALSSSGKPRDAADSLDEALIALPKDVSLWTLKGQVAIAAGLGQAAEFAFGKALEITPGNREATLGLATLFRVNNKPDEAIGLLQGLAKSAPDFLPGQVQLGDLLLANDKPDEALEVAEGLLKRSPDAVAGLVLKGRALYAKGQPSADWFERALKADPNELGALYYLASVRAEAAQFEAAVDLFRRLDTLAPGNQETLLKLAVCLMQLGKGDEAKTKFDEVVKLGADTETGLQAQQLMKQMQ